MPPAAAATATSMLMLMCTFQPSSIQAPILQQYERVHMYMLMYCLATLNFVSVMYSYEYSSIVPYYR